MFKEIAYFSIAGISLLVYLGSLALLFLIITIVIGFLVHKGRIKFQIHRLFAVITLIIALIHGGLAFGARFIG